MKGAIMQPYFFPYLAYYQLVCESDLFIFLDDANFIKQGFINRNSILTHGEKTRFTLPVNKQSSFRKISDHSYQGDFKDFLKRIAYSYKNHRYFNQIYPLIEKVLNDSGKKVAEINANSVIYVLRYLGIEKQYQFSSKIEMPEMAAGQTRVINICMKTGIKRYRNSIGGLTLYDKEEFLRNGIELSFLKSLPKQYFQKSKEFQPNLSIIDALMNCDPAEIRELLNSYNLN
jgi:hypothetical protein